MNVDWEKFTVAYANASTEIKNLLDSDTLPLIAEYLCLKFSLAPELRRVLVVCLINKTLNLSTDSELAKALGSSEVPTETIQHLLLAAEEKLLENSTTRIDSTVQPAGIPTIRTMQQPPAETVYTSTQAAILNESNTTSPAADPSAPRWDSTR